MGVAGVAMIAAIIFPLISLWSAFKYLMWKKRGILANATIISENGKEYQYDAEHKKMLYTTYIYTVKLEYNGNVVSIEYKENVDRDKPSELTINDTFEVYYDREKGEIKKVSDLKKNLKEGLIIGPVGCGVSLIVLFLCYYVVEFLSKA